MSVAECRQLLSFHSQILDQELSRSILPGIYVRYLQKLPHGRGDIHIPRLFFQSFPQFPLLFFTFYHHIDAVQFIPVPLDKITHPIYRFSRPLDIRDRPRHRTELHRVFHVRLLRIRFSVDERFKGHILFLSTFQNILHRSCTHLILSQTDSFFQVIHCRAVRSDRVSYSRNCKDLCRQRIQRTSACHGNADPARNRLLQRFSVFPAKTPLAVQRCPVQVKRNASYPHIFCSSNILLFKYFAETQRFLHRIVPAVTL